MTEMVTEKIDSFFSQFTRQIYKKGQILLWPDTQPDEIYFLRKGMIKEYLISKKGTEAVTYTFLPKSVFPLSCAVNNTKKSIFT